MLSVCMRRKNMFARTRQNVNVTQPVKAFLDPGSLHFEHLASDRSHPHVVAELSCSETGAVDDDIIPIIELVCITQLGPLLMNLPSGQVRQFVDLSTLKSHSHSLGSLHGERQKVRGVHDESAQKDSLRRKKQTIMGGK